MRIEWLILPAEGGCGRTFSLFLTCAAEGGCGTHAFFRPGFGAGFCISGVTTLSLRASADLPDRLGKEGSVGATCPRYLVLGIWGLWASFGTGVGGLSTAASHERACQRSRGLGDLG
jgi:hypothetical protein